MSFDGMLTRTVVIMRAAASTDARNNTVRNWADVTETTTKGWLAPAATSEDHDGRSAGVAVAVLFLPAGVDIDREDRVRVDGELFDVVGPPVEARRPSGVHHLEVPVRAVAG